MAYLRRRRHEIGTPQQGDRDLQREKGLTLAPSTRLHEPRTPLRNDTGLQRGEGSLRDLATYAVNYGGVAGRSAPSAWVQCVAFLRREPMRLN